MSWLEAFGKPDVAELKSKGRYDKLGKLLRHKDADAAVASAQALLDCLRDDSAEVNLRSIKRFDLANRCWHGECHPALLVLLDNEHLFATWLEANDPRMQRLAANALIEMMKGLHVDHQPPVAQYFKNSRSPAVVEELMKHVESESRGGTSHPVDQLLFNAVLFAGGERQLVEFHRSLQPLTSSFHMGLSDELIVYARARGFEVGLLLDILPYAWLNTSANRTFLSLQEHMRQMEPYPLSDDEYSRIEGQINSWPENMNPHWDDIGRILLQKLRPSGSSD